MLTNRKSNNHLNIGIMIAIFVIFTTAFIFRF